MFVAWQYVHPTLGMCVQKKKKNMRCISHFGIPSMDISGSHGMSGLCMSRPGVCMSPRFLGTPPSCVVGIRFRTGSAGTSNVLVAVTSSAVTAAVMYIVMFWKREHFSVPSGTTVILGGEHPSPSSEDVPSSTSETPTVDASPTVDAPSPETVDVSPSGDGSTSLGTDAVDSGNGVSTLMTGLLEMLKPGKVYEVVLTLGSILFDLIQHPSVYGPLGGLLVALVVRKVYTLVRLGVKVQACEDEILKLKMHVSTLQTSVQANVEEIHRLDALVTNHTTRIEELNDLLEVARVTLRRMRGELIQLRTRADAADGALHSHTEQINGLVERIALLEREREDLMHLVEPMRVQIGVLTADNALKNADIEALTAKLETVYETVARLKSHVHAQAARATAFEAQTTSDIASIRAHLISVSTQMQDMSSGTSPAGPSSSLGGTMSMPSPSTRLHGMIPGGGMPITFASAPTLASPMRYAPLRIAENAPAATVPVPQPPMPMPGSSVDPGPSSSVDPGPSGSGTHAPLPLPSPTPSPTPTGVGMSRRELLGKQPATTLMYVQVPMTPTCLPTDVMLPSLKPTITTGTKVVVPPSLKASMMLRAHPLVETKPDVYGMMLGAHGPHSRAHLQSVLSSTNMRFRLHVTEPRLWDLLSRITTPMVPTILALSNALASGSTQAAIDMVVTSILDAPSSPFSTWHASEPHAMPQPDTSDVDVPNHAEAPHDNDTKRIVYATSMVVVLAAVLRVALTVSMAMASH